MYKIYTDGSYKPTTDKGGYAVIITENDQVKKILHKGYIHTTNNRQELLGVLEALKYFKTPQHLEIYSDSSYIVTSINLHHAERWIEENDETKKNLDLWFQILQWCKFHIVSFIWVKGHNDNKYNELADLYANISAIVLNPEEDVKF